MIEDAADIDELGVDFCVRVPGWFCRTGSSERAETEK